MNRAVPLMMNGHCLKTRTAAHYRIWRRSCCQYRRRI